MPDTLIFSFAKLIDFYRTDMTNDAPEITEYMKNASVAQILAREDYWGQDLSFLLEEVERYVDKQA